MFIVFLLTRRLQIAVILQRIIATNSARAGVEMGQTPLETSGATTVASRRGGGGGGIYQWNIFQINCCAMLVARRCVYVWGWGAIVDVIFLLFLSLVIIALPCHVHFFFSCFLWLCQLPSSLGDPTRLIYTNILRHNKVLCIKSTFSLRSESDKNVVIHMALKVYREYLRYIYCIYMDSYAALTSCMMNLNCNCNNSYR